MHDGVDHRLGRQQFAQLHVVGRNEAVERREVQREQQRGQIEDEDDQEDAPVLNAEQQQEGPGQRVVDVQVAVPAHRPDDEHVHDQDQQGERHRADVLAEAMQARDQQRQHRHQHVVEVDRKQALEVVDRVEDQVRERVEGRDVRRDVHEALAPHDVRIGRHDAGGQQPLEPRRQHDAAFRLLEDEIASLHGLRAAIRCVGA